MESGAHIIVPELMQVRLLMAVALCDVCPDRIAQSLPEVVGIPTDAVRSPSTARGCFHSQKAWRCHRLEKVTA